MKTTLPAPFWKTATPPGQSKAAEATVPVEATKEFLMNVDCWIDAGSMGIAVL